jgi:hypothetical protein
MTMKNSHSIPALVLVTASSLLAACSSDGNSSSILADRRAASSSGDPGSSGAAAPSQSIPGTSGGVPAPGAPSSPDAGADSGASHLSGTVAGLVAVGYGGLRLKSSDGGKTWTGTAAANGGGDDYELLRAVAYASGKWLAVGWKATTSLDGVTWTTPARINEPGGVTWTGAPSCGLVEGLTSDGTYFYASCADYGQADKSFRSADGVTWTELGTIGNLGGHPSLAYRGGMFYAYGDTGASFRSTDGATWSAAAGLVKASYCENQWKSLSACHDASWFGGFYFQSEWQSKVTRSPDGSAFVVVHDDPSNNSLYQPRAMAEGFVEP